MKKQKTDRCGLLPNVLYLAPKAKVTLTFNLCPELGLANGSTGVVKDILYSPGTKPVDQHPTGRPQDVVLPYCVWVEMEDYCGPSFFADGTGKEKWFPIYPRTHMELHKPSRQADWREEEQTMIPLRLAWAWTIHKAQGQTIKQKFVLNLGIKEQDHGVTYVAISRATRLGDIGIVGGVTVSRITTHLSNNAKVIARKADDVRNNNNN